MSERMFKENLFDESVIGYGYEDLLYAFSLEKNQLKSGISTMLSYMTALKLLIFFIKNRKRSNKSGYTFSTKKNPTNPAYQKIYFLEEYGLISSFEWMYKKWKIIFKKICCQPDHL
ncbi:MAG: hypothetical protein IPO92_08840 [Saprospiraceae bacterium]|nr:hypothetical protein [Saprospiraceae bacterium]